MSKGNTSTTYSLDASYKRPTNLDLRTRIRGGRIQFSAFVPTNTSARNDHIAALCASIANGDLFRGRIDNAKFESDFGTVEEAIQKGTSRLQECSLNVVGVHRHNGEIRVEGSLGDIKRLIPNLDLQAAVLNGKHFRVRSGAHEVRAERGIFTAISGLDNQEIARPYFRVSPLRFSPLDSAAFTSLDLKRLWNLPGGTGTGQRIGIASLGGSVDDNEVFRYAREDLGVQGKIRLTKIGIDGTTVTADPGNSDLENEVDVAGCLGAADAEIFLVIGPNTLLGFAHVIAKLIELGCTIITISWGSPEFRWTEQGMDAMNTEFVRAAALGITVFAAAGDNDALDVQLFEADSAPIVSTDFPSSNPFVIAAIALQLSKDGQTVRKIWNDLSTGSGGGVSLQYPQQPWELFGPQVRSRLDNQIRHLVGGLAGPGDPKTPLLSLFGRGIGGTSVVGPEYAGMFGCFNQFVGKNLGFFLPFAMKNRSLFMVPVLEGNNAVSGGKGYEASELTIGTIDFTKFAQALSSVAA